ncbi:MAG TPA: tetratricopeptide repeat protein, partial [Myxococcales bacterium]|nr:tetratricopeptide repeat protein [Myxococcales bacterium]
CLLRGSEVAREGKNSAVGVARAVAAQRILKESRFDSELLQLRALMDVAESYRMADRSREALPAFEQAFAWLSSLGRDDTDTAGTLLNNWGMTLWDLGLPIEAERVFRRAIDISASDASEEGVSPMLLNNHARVLRDLGRLDEARRYAERAYAQAQRAGDEIVVNQSLTVRESIYRESGDLPHAEAMLAELEPRLRRMLPAGHIAFASLTSERSMLTQARGDAPAALGLANQALALAEASIKNGGQGAGYVPTLLLRRSGMELQLGRPGEADADAGRALQILQERAPPGTRSSGLGRAWLSRGRALQAQGKRAEASAAFTSATEHLERSVGPDHADTRAARELAAVTAGPG